LNHELLNTGCTKRYGLAFGETVLMSSPPNRSQMGVGVKHKGFAESGFGGWVDDKIKTVREAAPMLSSKNNPSTTFDNISAITDIDYYLPDNVVALVDIETAGRGVLGDVVNIDRITGFGKHLGPALAPVRRAEVDIAAQARIGNHYNRIACEHVRD